MYINTTNSFPVVLLREHVLGVRAYTLTSNQEVCRSSWVGIVVTQANSVRGLLYAFQWHKQLDCSCIILNLCWFPWPFVLVHQCHTQWCSSFPMKMPLLAMIAHSSTQSAARTHFAQQCLFPNASPSSDSVHSYWTAIPNKPFALKIQNSVSNLLAWKHP